MKCYINFIVVLETKPTNINPVLDKYDISFFVAHSLTLSLLFQYDHDMQIYVCVLYKVQ